MESSTLKSNAPILGSDLLEDEHRDEGHLVFLSSPIHGGGGRGEEEVEKVGEGLYLMVYKVSEKVDRFSRAQRRLLLPSFHRVGSRDSRV